MKKIFFLFAFQSFFQPIYAQVTLVDKMIAALSGEKSFSYTLGLEERYFSKTVTTESFVKVSLTPYRVYMKFHKNISPAKEVLYNSELETSKVYINLGKLIPNIKLEPLSSQMRENQHHTILDAGFGLVIKVIQEAKSKLGKDFAKNCQVLGEINYKNRVCTKVLLTFPNFGHVSYTIKPNENLYTLSQKNTISDYLILEKNGLRNYFEIKTGKTLLIPTFYCKKALFYIDNQTHFPLYQEIYDEKGIFEKYSFSNIIITNFTKNDFSTKNPEYGF